MHVSPHTLRHAVTAAYDAGVLLQDVQEATRSGSHQPGPARHLHCRRLRRRGSPLALAAASWIGLVTAGRPDQADPGDGHTADAVNSRGVGPGLRARVVSVSRLGSRSWAIACSIELSCYRSG
jgi:hypothetical protein